MCVLRLCTTTSLVCMPYGFRGLGEQRESSELRNVLHTTALTSGIVFRDTTSSPAHCRIIYCRQIYWVHALNERNYTFCFFHDNTCRRVHGSGMLKSISVGLHALWIITVGSNSFIHSFIHRWLSFSVERVDDHVHMELSGICKIILPA